MAKRPDRLHFGARKAAATTRNQRHPRMQQPQQNHVELGSKPTNRRRRGRKRGNANRRRKSLPKWKRNKNVF
eukprot:jgi/Psemu1/307788/fgenesh1_kg.353_\